MNMKKILKLNGLDFVRMFEKAFVRNTLEVNSEGNMTLRKFGCCITYDKTLRNLTFSNLGGLSQYVVFVNRMEFVGKRFAAIADKVDIYEGPNDNFKLLLTDHEKDVIRVYLRNLENVDVDQGTNSLTYELKNIDSSICLEIVKGCHKMCLLGSEDTMLNATRYNSGPLYDALNRIAYMVNVINHIRL